MTCIYKITSPTDKVYIGQTMNFKQRTGCYKSSHCKGQSKLYNSLQKHGWDNHKVEILLELREDIQPEMLTYWEQFFMDYYRELGYSLLNIREAGDHGKLSPETRKKMSKVRIGKVAPAETRKKMSKAHKGRIFSTETCKKISDSKRGHKHPLFGKHLSQETKQKMSEATRGERGNSFKGFVLAYKDGEFVGRYAGCTDAENQLGVSFGAVCKSIKQQRPLTRQWSGYQFFRESINLTSPTP